MNVKRTVVVTVVGMVAVGLLAGFRWAGRGMHDPERVRQVITWKVDDALDGIEASDAQRQEVHRLKDSLLDEGRQLMVGHRESRGELLAQWESATPDAQRVHALVDGRVDAMRAFAHRVADALLEVHRLLTPAQRQEVAQHARERAGRH